LVTELVTASPPTFPSLGDVGYLSYAVPVAVGLISLD